MHNTIIGGVAMSYMEKATQECITEFMANIEYYPVLREEVILEGSFKIPMTELATVGIPFARLIQDATEKALCASALESMPPLYALNMRGYTGSLAAMHDGSGFLTSIIGTNGQGVIGQAAFVPVKTGEIVSAGTVAIDPVLILATVILLSVNQKLDAIQSSQQDILDYLKNKDKAELRANLKTLTGIQNNYKFNLINAQYKQTSANMAQAVKKVALTHIEQNRNILQNVLKSDKLIHSEKNVKERLADINETLFEYQIAVHLYAFATFEEILMIENYKTEYLQSVIREIEEQSMQYRDLYIECYDFIENYMNTSLQTGAAKGLAVFSKTAGEALAKVPVLRKGPVDEVLIKAGNKMQAMNENRKQELLKDLVEKQSTYIRPFIENIEMMNRLYNEPKIMLFDHENLYLIS